MVKRWQKDLFPAQGHPPTPLGLSDGLTLRDRHPSANQDSKGECLFAQSDSEGVVKAAERSQPSNGRGDQPGSPTRSKGAYPCVNPPLPALV